MKSETTPASVKALERELKKADEQIAKTQEKYDSLYKESDDLKRDVKVNGDRYNSYTIDDKMNKASMFENQAEELGLDQMKAKAEELRTKLEDLKLNPQNTQEAMNLNNQLGVMESKLSQTKTEAQQTGVEVQQALNQKSNVLAEGVKNTAEGFSKAKNGVVKFGKALATTLSKGTIGKTLGGINDKISSFGKRITRLIGAVAIFNLIRRGLTNLRNGFMNLLNSNDQFKNSLNQIRGNLMTAFAPIYNACLPAINSLMGALVQITATIAKFTSSLFGQSLAKSTKQAKKLSGALKSASKSGKEASGSLASIDKLDVIGNDSGSSGGGGSNGNDFDYGKVTFANENLLKILEKIRGLISDGEWGKLAQLISSGIISALNFVTEKIKSIDFASIGKGISDFITNIDFSGIFVALVSVFGESVLGLQDLLLAIDWGTFFANLSGGLRDAIFKIADYIGQIRWSDIGKMLSDSFTSIDWGGIGSSILTALWNSLMGIIDLFLGIDWSAVGKKVSDSVHEWIDTIVEKFLSVDWGKLGIDIADKILDFIHGVDWGQLGIDILRGLLIGLASVVELIFTFFAELLAGILELFGIHSPSTVFADMGKNMLQGLINGLKSLLDGVINVFKGLWDSVVNGASKAWSGIKNVFSSVGSFFKDTFSKAWTAVKNIFSTGGKIFDGIKDGIVNGFKSIVNAIISGINKIVKTPFNSINSMLNKIRSTEILGVSPFKSLWKKDPISVPQIPKLAKGTVIPPRQEFLAILGDQKHGTNIEAPLETIKQANREVFMEFMDVLSKLNNNEREIVFKNLTIVAKFGDKDFNKVVVDAVRISEKELNKQLFVS